MEEFSLIEIWNELKEDKDFFINFESRFVSLFSEGVSSFDSSLMVHSSLDLIGARLFNLLFAFQKDPLNELYSFTKILAKNKILLKKIINKALLFGISEYADYLAFRNLSVRKIKIFIALVEKYLNTIEKAYLDYLRELEEKIVSYNRQKDELIFSLLNKILTSKENIEVLFFYQEIPILLNATIKKIENAKLFIEIKEQKHTFLKNQETVFLKHYSFPKTIAAKIEDINFLNEVIILKEFHFVTVFQEERRLIRVKPKEVIKAVIKKNGIKIADALIRDISICGIAVITENENVSFKKGEKFEIEFALLGEIIDVLAEIVSVEKAKEYLIVAFYYFEQLNLNSENIISGYISKREIEILKELRKL